MFVLSIMVAALTFAVMLINLRNKFSYVITLKMLCISFMMMIGTLYLTKSTPYIQTTYNHMSSIDYRLYSALTRLKADCINLSMLYNICFAAYMLVSVYQIKLITKLKGIYMLIPAVMVIAYLACNSFNVRYKLYILMNSETEFQNVYKMLYDNLNIMSSLLMNVCIILPYIVTFTAIIRTKIFTLRKYFLTFTAAILTVDIYMNVVFIYGKFKPIYAANVSLMKLPEVKNVDLNSLIKLPVTYMLIFGAVMLFIMIFKPFEINSGVRLNRLINTEGLFNNSMAAKEHVYKNAFISVGQQAMLAKKEIERSNFDAVSVNLDIINDIVKDYIGTIEKNLRRYSVYKYKMEPVNIAECVNAAMSKTITDNDDVSCICAYKDKNVTVMGDREHLVEVMVNLFMNSLAAMKRIERERELFIDFITEHGFVMIIIRDNGIGISPENIDKIFQPFYSTKPKNMCGGMGLSYVKKVIQRHGGEIRVLSRQNEFTEFQIVLPCPDNAE